MELKAPGSKILLHVCCAPCSGAIVEALCAEGYSPVIFWSNSNIYTAEENQKRLDTLLPYAEKFGVPVVVDEYDHESWRSFIQEQLSVMVYETPDATSVMPGSDRASLPDLASYPERGARCLQCFKYRLLRAARYAAANGFDCLTTSLASSRWKSLEQVEAAGRWVVMQIMGDSGTTEGSEPHLQFWPQNWRKGGLQPRRNEIIKEQNFYNQTFCGCEYSLNYEKPRDSKQMILR